ncbi:MAG: hypothetical protein J5526_07490 [Bacteroidales bacterium]|nr:hypothetical protein [Bacteroidales bacterium]
MSKKKIIYPSLLFFVIVGVALAVRLCPRTLPPRQCSELYRQYADTRGIDASFIKDYKVNDSVFVDVTMLEAKDDSTWSQLLDDFNIYQMTPEEIALYGSDQYTNVSVSIRPNYDYKGIPDSNRILNDIVSIYHPQRQLCVFHTSGNEGQFDVVFFIIENCINKSNIKIKRK